MDINTIKMLIVNLRNQGMTFQAIADKLQDEYGITRTRQSVAGLYARAVEQDPETLNIDKMKLILDILSVYSLGYNLTKTTEILNSIGVDVTYQKVNNLIKSNVDQLRSVNTTMLATLNTALKETNDPNELKDRLAYRGIAITEQRFTDLLSEVTLTNMRDAVATELAKLYSISNNRNLVKNMCEKGIKLSIAEVENKLKP